MAKYEVSMTYEWSDTIVVDADSYEQAEDLAYSTNDTPYVVKNGLREYWHSVEVYDVVLLDKETE